ncbi:MAG: uncharacterized protein QOF78_1185 [Phycisphaerales bacterium]|jgi:predicted nucleic acid-binding protein|nr:uncharacterized protein [Phycisphaerales bacterium]
MIFVDSGGWVAVTVPDDADHAAAAAWFAQNTQPLLTTDYIVDETLTLLRVRGQHARARVLAERFLSQQYARLHLIAEDDFRGAYDIFQRFHDKDWSFTDCTSYVVMQRLNIKTAFSFDKHFHQFATVAVVP